LFGPFGLVSQLCYTGRQVFEGRRNGRQFGWWFRRHGLEATASTIHHVISRLDLRGTLEPAGPARDAQLRRTLPRPHMATEPPVAATAEILEAVRTGGDAALRDLTKRFDKADIDTIAVPKSERERALQELPPLLREALEEAHANIAAYHHSTKPQEARYERNGIVVRDIHRPVERAGCYVPGGLAQYPSSVLMSAVPARVAGVDDVVLCVPPTADGTVSDVVLAAAEIAQVDELYRVGGAQAIGAMAYGTESVAPVDVIVGPGNIYVATAKRLVSGIVGVPSSFAGPSEVVVIADETAPAELAAIDVIVQAEHGPDGLAWVITWSEEVAEAIEASIATLVARSSRRAEIESTLKDGGYCVLVDDAQAAMDVANAVGPEHLQIMTVDPEALVPLAKHAGAVFTGIYAPASVGDYIAGPSHVLPVYGSARFGSALGVADFLRDQHVITMDQPTLARLAPYVSVMAEAEGLEAHAKSVQMRNRP
jgi:histidinol dehydrogenase